jgi:hypothetical protein
VARQGKGMIYRHGPANTRYLSIPSKVATDSAFPFRDRAIVNVRIVDGKLVIGKSEK